MILASYRPASGAARTDPPEALRQDHEQEPRYGPGVPRGKR